MDENIKKIVELDIDLENIELSDMGVEVVSLVTEPAIEVDFLSFAKECEDCFDLDEVCWPGYEAIGTKTKNGREVPNCVPIEATQEQFESYNDYPSGVKNNARRGIELNEKINNKCATLVGKQRAQQLAKGENISLETIKRMYSYLSRAETYYDEGDTEACGTISYLLWGGKAGKRWAASKLKELGELEATILFNKEEDKIKQTILEWADEYGEELTDDMIFIDESFEFNSATAVKRAVQGLGILSRLGINKDNPAETKYKYTGPSGGDSRDFCRGMLSLNKMYDDNDMDKLRNKLSTLNPGMGRGKGNSSYDVFKYKGGVSCRHFWSKVSVFRENGRVVVIDEGPAEGIAGMSNNENDPSPKGSVGNNASVSKQFSFNIMDNEKRIVAGPLMIPNSMILRRDESGEPYYVFFTKDTIRRIRERFNREYKINNTDTQHDGNIHTDNILLEQWIIESRQYDKSKFYGFDNLNLGTWFGVYKINNDEDWERVKAGELKGFSIAGNFIEKGKKMGGDELTLNSIINILKEIS